ncbi:hypothetical protein AAGW04_18280 [Pectobacterium aroidearum]|uniref:hypothetical protein n=1 Tax=Pectobacterium aroidearum TaxID=1201031 RepID=UPI003157F69F
MQSTQDQLSNLLWCILVALRTAVENHNITSERAKRKFIGEWLTGARRIPAFSGMAREFTTIRQLLQDNKSPSIDALINDLWKNSISTAGCDLFRFRAVLNNLFSQGWNHSICPWPEQIISEVIERRRSHKRHILQFTRMEEAFSAMGSMSAPITLQLLLKKYEDVQVEQSFYFDRFSVVQGREITLNKITLRTLYIGHHSLPESTWGARTGNQFQAVWRPKTH